MYDDDGYDYDDWLAGYLLPPPVPPRTWVVVAGSLFVLSAGMAMVSALTSSLWFVTITFLVTLTVGASVVRQILDPSEDW